MDPKATVKVMRNSALEQQVESWLAEGSASDWQSATCKRNFVSASLSGLLFLRGSPFLCNFASSERYQRTAC